MKVKILLNLPKTIDGKAIGPFRVGQEVDMPDTQARTFIASAMAEEVVEATPWEADEIKEALLRPFATIIDENHGDEGE